MPIVLCNNNRPLICVLYISKFLGSSQDSAVEVLPNLWHDLFRVMDDIKESVRLAAAKTVAGLSRTCIRMCDVTAGGAQSRQAGEKAIKAVLPVLLEKGTY